MTRTRYFTAMTLDGFLATEDHSLDWLLTRDAGDQSGPLGIDAFLAEIGAIAMGASTYEWILRHHPDDPWFYSQPCWVFTHRDLPAKEGADLTFTQAPVDEVWQEMAAAAGEADIWLVGGGDLVGQFHDAGHLDELLVSIAPVTIGAGRPLLPRHVELRLTELDRLGELAVARYAVLR